VPQIARVRDDEGARIRAYPRAHRLEGTPHVVFKSQRGKLVGGIPPRESYNGTILALASITTSVTWRPGLLSHHACSPPP
jgi:hypothetical protein